MLENPSSYVLAVGALGTAAFGLVDSTKIWWGGVSNCGFGRIRTAVTRLFPPTGQQTPPMPLDQALGVLRANWLNGTALADQKLIAKTLIKLRLDGANAAHLAGATGVNPDVLASVAGKIASGEPLTPPEQDVYGRFDLILTTQLDEAYQRADQIYRNAAKAAAVPIAVGLALLGGWSIFKEGSFGIYIVSADAGIAVLTGLIATPLAPISKDLASAITTAAKAVGSLGK